MNVKAILTALERADNHVGQPTFINIKTTIGHGTAISGTCKAHHAAFGDAEVRKIKKSWGYDPEATHVIPDDIQRYWSEIPKKGKLARESWEHSIERYSVAYPKLSSKLRSLIDGKLSEDWRTQLAEYTPDPKNMPIRQSSSVIFDLLWKQLPFFGGSADLSEPNFMLREPKEAFGPALNVDNAHHQSYRGRYVHFGTREHGMAGIANGIAAYSPKDEHGERGQAFIPITATFAMFQLYAAPAIRMGALMNLQVIHIGTHDSIAEGACGPTHQVRELDIREFLLTYASIIH